ncbi:MAG: hypothetical protein K6U87_05195 [Firmicutes bacterium]|nr:hypothetical protein [Bacillota bacterium]
MSVYGLNKVLGRVYRDPEWREQFLRDASALVAQVGELLDDEEGQALIHRDLGALYRRGLHPLLCLSLGRMQGMSYAEYVSAIRKGGATWGR